MSDITLSQAELEALTGYTQANKQLAALRSRGFHRACMARKGGVVLERAHYEAVCKGESEKSAPRKANLSFLRSA